MKLIIKGGEFKHGLLLGTDREDEPVEERNFATEDEAEAYIEGIIDGNGWLTVEECDDFDD